MLWGEIILYDCFLRRNWSHVPLLQSKVWMITCNVHFHTYEPWRDANNSHPHASCWRCTTQHVFSCSNTRLTEVLIHPSVYCRCNDTSSGAQEQDFLSAGVFQQTQVPTVPHLQCQWVCSYITAVLWLTMEYTHAHTNARSLGSRWIYL